MTAIPLPIRDPSVEASFEILEEVFGGIEPRDFAFRLWDGTGVPPAPGKKAKFTIALNHAGALRNMFRQGSEVGLGEAYIYGDYDVEGELEAAIRMGFRALENLDGWGRKLKLRSLLARLPKSSPERRELRPMLVGRVHTRERDSKAVRHHYDMPPEFFALFLDRKMIYSSGYFNRPDDDLETAQTHKLEAICRDLQLQPGERMLDIGCGWGGLIIYAATNFGAQCLGITLSEKQAATARRRIREAGLEDRCRVEVCDYRDLQPSQPFDKITSIGMVEHVGARQLPEYFRQAWRLLRNGGRFVNSGISRPLAEHRRHALNFTETYVFPDGELEPIEEMLAAAERAGFRVCSAENHREDYGFTLRHWVQRLEANAAEARRLVGEVAYRIWRLYMAGSAVNFLNGKLDVFQTVLEKPAIS